MKKLLLGSIFSVILVLVFSFTAFAEHDPVIFIPGLTAEASAMDSMKSSFAQSGWSSSRLFTWTDSTNMTGDLGTAGIELGTKIDTLLSQTGAQKVVLITWSASTLAARHYLKYGAGAQNKVSMYFSMAGPHHGTSTWTGCTQYTACQQFAPNSDFLNDLNAGTEVPGSPDVIYTTYRSKCDTRVDPTDSAMLAGADNRYTPTCISHFLFPYDADLSAEIRGLIEQYEGEIPPGAYVNITAPADGLTVGNVVTITASASGIDENGGVEFFVGNVSECVDPSVPYTCSWDTTEIDDGDYDLKVVATDASTGDLLVDDDTTVTVDNSTPSYVTAVGTISGHFLASRLGMYNNNYGVCDRTYLDLFNEYSIDIQFPLYGRDDVWCAYPENLP